MTNKEYKAKARTGPGGFKCGCCGPAPGKERKQVRRLVRHRSKRAWKKEADAACKDIFFV